MREITKLPPDFDLSSPSSQKDPYSKLWDMTLPAHANSGHCYNNPNSQQFFSEIAVLIFSYYNYQLQKSDLSFEHSCSMHLFKSVVSKFNSVHNIYVSYANKTSKSET
jgi:hypothetical protein